MRLEILGYGAVSLWKEEFDTLTIGKRCITYIEPNGKTKMIKFARSMKDHLKRNILPSEGSKVEKFQPTIYHTPETKTLRNNYTFLKTNLPNKSIKKEKSSKILRSNKPNTKKPKEVLPGSTKIFNQPIYNQNTESKLPSEQKNKIQNSMIIETDEITTINCLELNDTRDSHDLILLLKRENEEIQIDNLSEKCHTQNPNLISENNRSKFIDNKLINKQIALEKDSRDANEKLFNPNYNNIKKIFSYKAHRDARWSPKKYSKQSSEVLNVSSFSKNENEIVANFKETLNLNNVIKDTMSISNQDQTQTNLPLKLTHSNTKT